MSRRFARALAAAALAAVAAGSATAGVAVGAPTSVPGSVDPQWPVDEKGDGCTAPWWPKAKKSQEFRRVLVVGDSLIRNSRTILEAKLAEAGWLPTVRCWGAKGSDWGVEQINRARELGQLPDTIVISLGTNDIWWLHIPMDVAVDSIMAAVGDEKTVYWVNLWFGPNGYDDLPKPTAANRILRTKAKEYPNLRIINFAKAFVDAEKVDPSVGWEDGVHLNERGNRVRVKSIVDTLGVPMKPVVTPKP